MGLVLSLGTKTESTVGIFVRLLVVSQLNILLASASVIMLG